MHIDAIDHANEVQATRDAADDHLSKQERYITDRIFEVLTETVRNVDHEFLSLPYVSGTKVAARSLMEVVTDEVAFGKPAYALMAVIAKSDCPHVQALRLAIAKRYAGSWAADIAEVTSE